MPSSTPEHTNPFANGSLMPGANFALMLMLSRKRIKMIV